MRAIRCAQPRRRSAKEIRDEQELGDLIRAHVWARVQEVASDSTHPEGEVERFSAASDADDTGRVLYTAAWRAFGRGMKAAQFVELVRGVLGEFDPHLLDAASIPRYNELHRVLFAEYGSERRV